MRSDRRLPNGRHSEALSDPAEYPLLAFGREILELIKNPFRDVKVI
jgi:hypothetical protein